MECIATVEQGAWTVILYDHARCLFLLTAHICSDNLRHEDFKIILSILPGNQIDHASYPMNSHKGTYLNYNRCQA